MGELSDGTAYNDDECDEFCGLVADLFAMFDRIEAERGPDYADEYRRQFAELITERIRERG